MPNSDGLDEMINRNKTPSTHGVVLVTDLAAEFNKDIRTVKKWLLRHDITVSRRAVLCPLMGRRVAVLTDSEAQQAGYLYQHGVLLQNVSR